MARELWMYRHHELLLNRTSCVEQQHQYFIHKGNMKLPSGRFKVLEVHVDDRYLRIRTLHQDLS